MPPHSHSNAPPDSPADSELRAGKPDPEADYWTVSDVAGYWGVKVKTVRVYRSRGRGELPEPDRVFGGSPVWRPATIIGFKRPGKGARTDLKGS